MITKNKIVRLLGVLLIMLFPLSGGVFSGNNVVHAQTNNGNPVQVYFNDFDGGAIVMPGVTATLGGVASLESVQSYDGYGFGGDFLRNDTGGYDDGGLGTPGSPTTLTLVGLPPHTSIDINFLLAIIDSWDGSAPGEGEGACTDCHPDILTITVDGTQIFSEAFGSNGSVFEPSPAVLLTEPTPLGFNPEFDDAAYDMGVNPTFDDIPHSASTLTIEWFASGDGWQGGLDELWAIDNLEIDIGDLSPLSPPAVQVEINHNWVTGWNWPVGHLIALTINGEEIDSQVVFDEPWGTEVNFNSWDTGFEYDIQPGDVVTLEDTVTGESKTHTALNIGITKVDTSANTVEGYADAGRELVIWADSPCDKDVWVTADTVDGTWVAYFDCNLSEIEQNIHLEQYGIDDTTYTSYYWNPPHFQVDISRDWVYGWDWLPGTLVNLTIDDPDIPGMDNYTDTKLVADDTSVAFDFAGVYFVEPGHIVTVSDGGITEIYEVENLDVYEVDLVTDIIKGKAEPGKEIEVTVGSAGWISVPVETNAVTGEWEVDFTGIADLTSDSWGNVRSTTSWSENHTQYWWNAPLPTTHEVGFWWQDLNASKYDEIVLRAGWGACTPGLVKAFQKAAHIDITINGEPLYPEGDEALYWGTIEPTEIEGCKAAPKGNKASASPWIYHLGSLEPGIYEVYVHYWLDHPLVDGGDWDGDGKMDKIEGTLVENTITIIVK